MAGIYVMVIGKRFQVNNRGKLVEFDGVYLVGVAFDPSIQLSNPMLMIVTPDAPTQVMGKAYDG